LEKIFQKAGLEWTSGAILREAANYGGIERRRMRVEGREEKELKRAR